MVCIDCISAWILTTFRLTVVLQSHFFSFSQFCDYGSGTSFCNGRGCREMPSFDTHIENTSVRYDAKYLLWVLCSDSLSPLFCNSFSPLPGYLLVTVIMSLCTGTASCGPNEAFNRIPKTCKWYVPSYFLTVV